jgi:hypothetical protein
VFFSERKDKEEIKTASNKSFDHDNAIVMVFAGTASK